MPIDFRPTELDVRCVEDVTYTMSIIHKGSGMKVAGHGPNKYQLECNLLDKLRERLEKRDDAASG